MFGVFSCTIKANLEAAQSHARDGPMVSEQASATARTVNHDASDLALVYNDAQKALLVIHKPTLALQIKADKAWRIQLRVTGVNERAMEQINKTMAQAIHDLERRWSHRAGLLEESVTRDGIIVGEATLWNR